MYKYLLEIFHSRLERSTGEWIMKLGIANWCFWFVLLPLTRRVALVWASRRLD